MYPLEAVNESFEYTNIKQVDGELIAEKDICLMSSTPIPPTAVNKICITHRPPIPDTDPCTFSRVLCVVLTYCIFYISLVLFIILLKTNA